MNAVYHWMWTLLPGNPMIVRIVQGGSRRAQHLWLRMAYLGALIGLVLIGLVSGGALGGETTLSDLAKAGTWVFAFIAYGQVVLVCLLAPLFMAGAIGEEQAGRTYDILLTTPLSNVQIVLGSLFGRLFFVLALLASGLPLCAILLVFGGVPIPTIVKAFAVAGLTAIFVGAVAVTLSVFRAGGRKAVFTFVITIGAYLVAAYAVDVVLLRNLPGASGSTTVLTPLHPLLVLESMINSANYAPPLAETVSDWSAPVAFYLSQPFAAYALITGLLSLVLILSSALVVRQVGQGESRWLHGLKKRLRLGEVGGGARRRKARAVGANPIAWRESNTRGKVASGIIARWGFLVVGTLLGLGLIASYHFGWMPKVQNMTEAQLFHAALMTLLLLEVSVVTLVAIYMSAGCVSKEREDGTLDIMLTTPMTAKYYIWGKLQGLVRFLSLMIAAPVGTLILAGLYSLLGWLWGWPGATFQFHYVHSTSNASFTLEPLLVPVESGPLLLVMLVPFVALCVAAGMNWSLKAKGVFGAVVPTLAIIGALALVLGFCGLNAAGQIPFVGPVVNAFSPATNLWMLINPWAGISGYPEHPLSGRICLVVGALLAAAAYCLVVYAMILNMVKGFDHTVRKLSGTG